MNRTVDDRAIVLGRYIVETGATVRSCARKYGISKSTVHQDVTHRLKKIDNSLYIEVKNVLLKNKAERHIIGGIATKNKYERMKKV